MDGLWVLLLAAFGIASAVMKRLEKSSSTTGERPPSSDLKRYLDTVGDMMKEVEGSLKEPKQGQGHRPMTCSLHQCPPFRHVRSVL